MPRYQVTAKGFMHGRSYDPNGKRKVLHSDKPIKPVPSWLKPMKEESTAAKKKRESAEKKDKTADDKRIATDKSNEEAITFAAPTGGIARDVGIETL